MDVAAEPVAFAPHDLGRLEMDLQARVAVHDVHAGPLELARPLDVPPLVETSLQLDEADALLSVLRRLDQRRHERRLVARPVHGRLQPDHVAVLRGRADERLERRRERLVGMMDELVAATDLGEQVVVRDPGREARRSRSEPGRVAQVGAFDPQELRELRQVEQPADLVHVRVVDVEAQLEPLDHRARHLRGDLQANDVAEAAPPQLELDRLEQVVGLVGDLEVRVPRDAEDRALGELHLREERREKVGDHVLERNPEPAPPDLHEARHALRHLDARESLVAGVRVPHEHAERERQRRDVRERLPGPDAERRQHGIDLALEPRGQLGALLVGALLDACRPRSLLRRAPASGRAPRGEPAA